MGKKVALVLGGNGGIGSAAVQQLINDGYFVCATYFSNNDKISKIFNEAPASLSIHQCDVRDGVELSKIIESILLTHGAIDTVVFTITTSLKNNQMLELSWDDYKNHFDLQIKVMFFTVKALDEQIKMKHKIKFIVILTEYCISNPPKGLSHYVTSKYAALGMAKTMAVELSQYKCTTNMILPGMVETPLLDSLPSKLVEITAYQNPLKRNASATDVANIISFLASDKSDYLNGANIAVNGGGVLS